MHTNDRALDFVPYSVNGLCAIRPCANFLKCACLKVNYLFLPQLLLPLSWGRKSVSYKNAGICVLLHRLHALKSISVTCSESHEI